MGTGTETSALKKKLCPGCDRDRDIGDFWKNSKRPDGRQVYCRFCRTKPDSNGEAPPKPVWERADASRSLLLRQKEKYLAMIDCCHQAIERIDERLRRQPRKQERAPDFEDDAGLSGEEE